MRRAPLLALVLAAACSPAGPGSSAKLPDLSLPTLAGKAAPSLAACPTAKCLTIFVAPWCGYCRAGTALFIRAKAYLKIKGVETRIVVSMDGERAVRDYALEFGPETLLDPENKAAVGGGVPHMFVSDAAGTVLKEVPGLPRVETAAEFADFLGLP